MKDGLDRTLWNTGFTVNALIRVDVEHFLAFIEALDRANYDTVRVSATVTRLGYYVSHSCTPDFDE